MNRGDAAGALSLFSEDAVYLGDGCQPEPCVGKAAIGRQLTRNVGTRTQLVGADLSGTRLMWRAVTDSDSIRAAGFDHVATMGTMLGHDNLIADYRVWFDVTDPSTSHYVDELTSTQVRAPAHPEPDTKYAAITDAQRGLCTDAANTITCGPLDASDPSAGCRATLAPPNGASGSALA